MCLSGFTEYKVLVELPPPRARQTLGPVRREGVNDCGAGEEEESDGNKSLQNQSNMS